MNSLILTTFTDVHCASAKEFNCSWSKLFTNLQNVKAYSDKKSASLIKLAKFGDNRTNQNSLKHDGNLIELWGIEGDYDAGVMTIHEACKLLERHNIRAILHTSWSSTPDKPRWRVLTPLSKAFPKEDHRLLVARLNGALGGVLAGESFTLAQGYFIGKNPQQTYTCICTFNDPMDGEFIDLIETLEPIALGRVDKPKQSDFDADVFHLQDWRTEMLAGEDIHGNALRLVGRMVSHGHDDQTILDTFEGWQDELTSARGKERVADLFSGELMRMIQGARDKGYAPVSLADVQSKMRKLSVEDLRKRWLELLVPLSPTDRSIALPEICILTSFTLHALKKELKNKDNEIRQAAKSKALASRIGDRLNILYEPENIATTADAVEVEVMKHANDFELAKFAGLPVRIVIEKLPLAHYADSEMPAAPTAQTEIITKPKLLPLVERAVVFQTSNANGHTSNIAVPDKILEHILANNKVIPSISAMVTHPVVTTKGRIIHTSGIDSETGLLLYGDQDLNDIQPYTQIDAALAINRIKDSFLSGFEFSSELDKTAALALLFTAVQRKLMPAAPGGLISAAQQSTGKTTFVKILHIILTGRDLPVMSWPEGNETEVQKMLLSTLLRSPELICFDNVGDGLTFRSPTLALAMTSPVYEGRVLSMSRDASVPTNVMMTATGNNIKLGNDEVHRWIKVSLTTSDPSPHKRQFDNTDVLKYALSIREQVLRDCIGIIAGYCLSKEKIPSASRFPQWDEFVRQPLMWAYEDDVGKVFDKNMENSEEMSARTMLLVKLKEKFKEEDFGANDIADLEDCFNDVVVKSIREALKLLHVKDVNSFLSVGHALGKAVGIPVIVPKSSPQVTLTLTRREGISLSRYWIETKLME